MKKILLTLAVLISAFAAKAQQIDSIVMVPAAPTTLDVITVYTYLSFPQGNCADVGTVFVSGNTVYGYGFHCMGNAMFICNDVDTVTFGPLPAGSYTYISTLDAGFGPPGNCSPGFLPYDRDTVPFTVTLSTDIPETQQATFSVYPNPASNVMNVNMAGSVLAKVELLNVLGETVAEVKTQTQQHQFSLEGLAPGVYFCRATDANGMMYQQLVEVVR